MTFPDSTLIKIIDLRSGREISWGSGMTEKLRGRIDDVQQAMTDGVQAISAGLSGLSTADGWQVDEVAASFGIALAAETGVVLTKASGEATFEVEVTFRRTQ